MEKIHRNMRVFVLTCKFLTCKNKNMHVTMYILRLVLTFTPPLHHSDKRSIANANIISGWTITHWRKCLEENDSSHILAAKETQS